MRKNRLITLLSSLTMAVAGIGAIAAGASESKKADEASAADTIDVYFTRNNSGLYDYARWDTTPKIYYWGSSGNAWPGVDMTAVYIDSNADQVYKYSVPSGTTGIIFNNGGNFQTTDVTSISNNKGFYLKNDSWWDGGQGKRFFNWDSFDVKPYTINYFGNGNTSGSMSSTNAYANVSWGLTENAFVKTNYIFNGWNTKSDGSGTAYSDKALIAKDAFSAGSVLNLYAQWLKDMPNGVYLGGPWGWGRNATEMSDNPSTANEKMITVSLDANDGVKAVEYNNNVEQYHGASAEPTVESEAATDGYTATGHGDDNSVVNRDGIYTVYVNTSTWTYHFKPLRIKYNSNGGSGSMSSTYASAAGEATVSDNTFTYSEHRFTGWNTQADGEGVNYSATDVIDDFLTTGENVTLYAQWEEVAQTYTVNYLANTSDTVTDMPSAETGVPAGPHTLSSQTPSRANYRFVGWNTNSSATTGMSSVTITNSDVNVYAIWREFNPHNGRWIEFSTKGSSSQVDRIAMDYSNNEWSADAQLYEGDEFKIVYYGSEVKSDERGFSDLQPGAQGFGQIVVGTTDAMKVNVHDSSKTSNDVYSGTYHITFNDGYTEFKSFIQRIQYTVTYHANNGTAEADRAVHPEVGSKFTTESYTDASFTPPTNKVFKGWNTASDGSGTSYNINDQVEGSQYFNQTTNYELYAMWGDPVADGMYLRGSFDWTAQGQIHMIADESVENQYVAKGVKLENNNSVKAVGYSSNYESWIAATSAGVPSDTGYSASVDSTNAKISGGRGVFNVYVKTTDGSYNFYPLRVNYNANGGSGDSMSSSFPTGAGYLATVSENTYTAPSENMRFNGWNTAADGSGTSYNASSTIDFSSRTEDLTLYAQWLGKVTLTYTDNQGTRTFTGYPGDAFVAPAARDKVGYTTVGWSNTYTTYPNQNTTVTAVYDAINYAISFNAGDGASGGSVSPSTYNISDTAQTVTITPPSKEGATPSYTIVGDDYVGTVPTISGTTVTIPAGSYGDFSVITTWTPITPTVTIEIEGNGYVVDDEGNEVETLTVEYGDEFIFDNENGEALIGDYTIYAIGGDSTQQYNYVFKEWSIDPACESITGNVTITATFEPELRTYSLSYGGSGYTKPTSPAEGSHEYGTEIQNAPVATKEHYTLKGWYTDASLTHEVTFPYTITNDVTLYPKFEIEKETITITINGNYGVVKDDNGNVVTSIDVPYGTYVGLEDDNSITLLADNFEAYLYPVANKAGDEYKYSFTSWTGITDGEEITGNKTIYANFSQQKQTYTITFYDEDCETLLDTQIVEYGETPVYGGIIPTKESSVSKNYTFDGWTENLAPVTGDKSYFAKYAESPREYTITWKNGDTSLGTTSVAYGQTPVYTGETPTKEGTEDYTYTFTGWTPEITSVTGEATYTAAFRQDLTDLGIAKDYASRFVEDLHKDGLCAITGYDEKGNPIYNPDMEELQKFWDKYSKEFNALSTAAENYLKSATPDSSEEASVLNSFAWSYQYVYTKYGKNFADYGGDFLKKGYTPNSSRLVSVSDISTSTWIIAAVAVVGIAAVGVFFIYKKRKEI